jgi:hypothetical protein
MMLKKLLVFAAINATIALLAASAPMRYVGGRPYEAQAELFAFIEKLPIDTPLNIILGDSRSECCIAAENLGFVNLSLEGSTPVEGVYILERLLERGTKLNQLILSYGPFHIFTHDIFHSRTRQFGIFDSDFVAEVQHQADELHDAEYQDFKWPALQRVHDMAPQLSDTNKFALIKALTINTTLAALLRELRRRLFGAEQTTNEKHFKLTARDAVNFQSESPEALQPNARAPVNEHYLQRLVSLAIANDIAFAFLVTPFNNDVMQPNHDYFERFSATIRSLGFDNCYAGFEFWPNEMFADAAHLNRRGAERFNADLQSKLEFCAI